MYKFKIDTGWGLAIEKTGQFYSEQAAITSARGHLRRRADDRFKANVKIFFSHLNLGNNAEIYIGTVYFDTDLVGTSFQRAPVAPKVQRQMGQTLQHAWHATDAAEDHFWDDH